MTRSQTKPAILTDILVALAFLVAVLVPLRILMAGASILAGGMFGR